MIQDLAPSDPGRAALLAAGAFAAGVQLRLLALGGLGNYPPPGSEGLAWSTLLLLAGVLMVAAGHLEDALDPEAGDALAGAASQAGDALQRIRRAAATTQDASEPSTGTTVRVRETPETSSAAEAEAAQASLTLRLETPFGEAPAVAPGEEVPVRVHLEAPGLDEAATVRLSVREGRNRRARVLELEGGASAVRSVTFQEEGPVEVRAEADHPRAREASARAPGRCQPYREAVGDLLDDLRDAASKGLADPDGATPRQVCAALPAGPTEALRDRLEAVLYGDDGVTREAYLEVADLRDRVLARCREGST